MLLSTKLLGSNGLVTLPVEFKPEIVSQVIQITRKKKRNTPSPHEKDVMAWRWEAESDVPEMVVRSPMNRSEWINPLVRRIILMSITQNRWGFKTANSWEPVLDPAPGTKGWIKLPRKRSRVKAVYDGSVWNIDFKPAE